MKVVDVKVVRSKGHAVAVIKLKENMEIYTSPGVLNIGHIISDTLMIMEVPKRYDRIDPLDHIEEIRKDLGLPDNTVGFMTAAEIEYVTVFKETEFEGFYTSGEGPPGLGNRVIAGDVNNDMEERLIRSAEKEKRIRSRPPGTINIIAISPVPLTETAKLNAFIAVTEAKT
ncbi:MAG: adenosylcobinamide amidohydrolase, partial [Methanomassiliicoccaceae archaeon]|nr:adenosylcobinamide amidohydrolase [Methanomassiliicoccaceae archaeon]